MAKSISQFKTWPHQPKTGFFNDREFAARKAFQFLLDCTQKFEWRSISCKRRRRVCFCWSHKITYDFG